jgi:hypothetical protein
MPIVWPVNDQSVRGLEVETRVPKFGWDQCWLVFRRSQGAVSTFAIQLRLILKKVVAFRQKIPLGYRSGFFGSSEFPEVNLAK